jgi:DNA polymerase I-like protein with 3'-5' exonuclease and polymerase domains
MTSKFGADFGGEMYYKFRNYCNNAKNFPIQATAAHVCNAAMIKLSKLFKKNSIDGWLALTVHDELCCIVKDDQAEFAAELLQDSMQNNWVTEKIDVPILAEPIIADNMAEAK